MQFSLDVLWNGNPFLMAWKHETISRRRFREIVKSGFANSQNLDELALYYQCITLNKRGLVLQDGVACALQGLVYRPSTSREMMVNRRQADNIISERLVNGN